MSTYSVQKSFISDYLRTRSINTSWKMSTPPSVRTFKPPQREILLLTSYPHMHTHTHVPVWKYPHVGDLISCGSTDRWSFDILVFFAAVFPLSGRYWREGSPAWWYDPQETCMCGDKHVNHMYMYRRMHDEGLYIHMYVKDKEFRLSLPWEHTSIYVCITGKTTIDLGQAYHSHV